jgi:hypothetical protein
MSYYSGYRRKYYDHGPDSKSEESSSQYQRSQRKPRGQVVREVIYLKQKDFDNGTYRITRPGKYVLAEDIVFEPNAKDNYFPRPDQKEYSHPAYHLGFFAAITIESRKVVLDLNGHTLKQGKIFSIQQRFYANIELTNAPFIPGEGPGNFGPLTGSAYGCIIKNGTIGRSSHHGIHGNNVRKVLLKNLIVRDFEVAGIAINGFNDLAIKKSDIEETYRDVPVTSAYSAGRFLTIRAGQWLKQHGSRLSPEIKKEFETKLAKLQSSLDQVVKYVAKDEVVPSTNYFAMPIHKTPWGDERLPDANAYGLVFHVVGTSVMDYIEEDTKQKLSENLSLEDVCVRGIRANVVEIVAISNADQTGIQNDVSGSVFRLADVVDKVKNGGPTPDAVYKGTVLSDAQLIAAKASLSINEPIGRNNLDASLIEWALSGAPFESLLKKGYRMVCNGDAMFHVQKGVHGIRIDGVINTHLENVHIEKVSNVGRLGATCDGHYNKSNPDQKRAGYTGAYATGLSLSYVHHVFGKDVLIHRVHSDNSTARGVRFINESQNVTIDDCRIKTITTGAEFKDGCWYGVNADGELVLFTSCLPNLAPLAFGVCIEIYDDEPSQQIRFPGIKIRNIAGVGNGSLNYAWQTIHDADEYGQPSRPSTEEDSEYESSSDGSGEEYSSSQDEDSSSVESSADNAECECTDCQCWKGDQKDCKCKDCHCGSPSPSSTSSPSSLSSSSKSCPCGLKCKCASGDRKSCKCGKECHC